LCRRIRHSVLLDQRAAVVEHHDIALDDTGAFTNGRYSVDVVASVPEPSTTALLLAGFGVAAWAARRRPVRVEG